MKIQGAVIIEQGVTFAIVMPIILMSQDSNGTPHYYGRKDIVAFLRTIRLDQIPWKEYHIY